MQCPRCELDVPSETIQEAIENLTIYFERLPTAEELQRELYDSGFQICIGELYDRGVFQFCISEDEDTLEES